MISVTGEVVEREARFVNKAIKSGQVELRAEAIQILASSKPLPFELDQHAHTGGRRVAAEVPLSGFASE